MSEIVDIQLKRLNRLLEDRKIVGSASTPRRGNGWPKRDTIRPMAHVR